MKHIDYSRTTMLGFASSTGLTHTSTKPDRYLWTDAFAVCNFLSLYQHTNEEYFLKLALKLVDQVHSVLGKHRSDSNKHGWISGLNDTQALLHPTQGGLRIGKKLKERQIGERVNKRLEWEQDGQYFHYLTKWMHALNRVSQVTGKSTYNRWAIELAKKTYSAFTHNGSKDGGKYLYWKMSVDLSCPLVNSMGHHDPLDGYITYLQLEATSKKFGINQDNGDLTAEIEGFSEMCIGRDWRTVDGLGIGGLLVDSYRLIQMRNDYILKNLSVTLEGLLDDCLLSLEEYYEKNHLNQPAEHRLAFREFGVSIGLHCIVRIQKIIEKISKDFDTMQEINIRSNQISRYQFMIPIIEDFWLQPKNQSSKTWIQHININKVMLVTSLIPEGYLGSIQILQTKNKQ